MYTKKLLIFLLVNYLPVFIWILLFSKGSFIVLFLIPFNVLLMTFDYLFSYGIKELRTAFLHLIIANAAGAVLQGIILFRYPLAPEYSILTMFLHILFFTLFIFIGMFALKKPVQRRRKKKDELFLKKKEAYDKYMAEHAEDAASDDEDEGEFISRRRIDYDNDLEYDDLDAEDREDTSLYGDYRPASGKDKNQE